MFAIWFLAFNDVLRCLWVFRLVYVCVCCFCLQNQLVSRYYGWWLGFLVAVFLDCALVDVVGLHVRFLCSLEIVFPVVVVHMLVAGVLGIIIVDKFASDAAVRLYHPSQVQCSLFVKKYRERQHGSQHDMCAIRKKLMDSFQL